MIAVEVQNFGQVASQPSPIKIVYNADGRESEAGSGKVPPLAPFEKTVVEFPCDNLFKEGTSYETSVIIHPQGQRPVTLQRSLNP